MTDRAVSDAVGFVLILALVLTMVGITYGAGVTELQSASQSAQLTNAERAFGVLQRNVDDLVHEEAASRATTIRLGGATVQGGEPVTFNLTLVDEGRSYAATTTPIVYRADDTSIVYVNGAVIRAEREGAIMVDRPDALASPFVFPYVVTDGHGDRSVGGQTTTVVRTSLSARETFVRATDGPYDLRLEVTTPRTGVWRRYLEAEHDATCSTTGQTLSCAFTTERVYVPLVTVDVAFN